MAGSRTKRGSSDEGGNGATYRRRKLKHAILTVLGRDALKRLADDLELEADRRSVQQMRQILSRSHRASPDYLAECLYETDAKVVCESIGQRGFQPALRNPTNHFWLPYRFGEGARGGSVAYAAIQLQHQSGT